MDIIMARMVVRTTVVHMDSLHLSITALALVVQDLTVSLLLHHRRQHNKSCIPAVPQQ